jgi:AcrR family transcriptional regulator
VETVEKILKASEELLAEKGLQGFNTNVVAAHAEINVGTVYHYFPDKNSILRELFLRSEQVRYAYLVGRMAEFQTTNDVGDWVQDVVKGLIRLRLVHPSVAVLRRSILAIPELAVLEAESAANSASVLARALKAKYPKASASRIKWVAEVLVTISVALLDRIDDSVFPPKVASREISQALTAYLETLSS